MIRRQTVTVEKQNIDLETPFSLREILEIANDAKTDSVDEVVIKILTRDGSMTAEGARKLIDEVAPPPDVKELGSWVPGS
jgi:hypothetical protein